VQVSRERNPETFRYVLAGTLVSTRFDFMNGPETNYVFSHLASEFLAAFLTFASSHSLLFPFLWIWPSNDACFWAYITRRDEGGVWWVL